MLGEEAAKASNGIPMRIGNPNRTLTPRPNPSYSIQLRGCITVMANIKRPKEICSANQKTQSMWSIKHAPTQTPRTAVMGATYQRKDYHGINQGNCNNLG
jgi:hypothetical protein